MICINPLPEPYKDTPFPGTTVPTPIVKPREDETLQSWLARKNHALLFHSWYPYLQFNDGEFGVLPREGY